MSAVTLGPAASEPVIGAWVPTATLHLLFLAVAAGLSVLVLPAALWLAVGLALAVAGTFAPNRVPTWWLLLLLSASQLWRDPSATDIVYYLLLAGVHLLHVLGSLARLLPWSGRMQIAALAGPLKRFALVQMVVQPVALGALQAFGGEPGVVPWLSILAAAALSVVAAVLFRGMRTIRQSQQQEDIVQ
jgi:hypothetical protein